MLIAQIIIIALIAGIVIESFLSFYKVYKEYKEIKIFTKRKKARGTCIL
jgi:hypothetical protein